MSSTSDLEEGEYIVESVLSHRIKKGKFEYLLKWKGYSSDENTWESDVSGCQNLVKSYLELHNVIDPKFSNNKKSEEKKIKKTQLEKIQEKQIEIINISKLNEEILFTIKINNEEKTLNNKEMKQKYLYQLISFYERYMQFIDK